MKTIRRIIFAVSVLLLLGSILVIIFTIFSTKSYEAGIRQITTQFREQYITTETIPPASSPVSDPVSPAGPEVPVKLPERVMKLMEDMREYNAELFATGQAGLTTTASTQVTILDPRKYGFESGVVGIVRIPAISVEMPLYLGASYENLAHGFATISNTSFPVGDSNTNTVIMGHRGYQGAPHLRDIEQLSLGDSVFLDMPWGTLEYTVSEFRIIAPNDLSALHIRPGEDMVTLVTCHPYRVSTHRILVYCDRKGVDDSGPAATEGSSEAVTAPERPAETITVEKWIDTAVVEVWPSAGSSAATVRFYTVLPWVSLCLLTLLLITVLLLRRRR